MGIPPDPGKEETREIRGQTSVTQAPPDLGKEESREIRSQTSVTQAPPDPGKEEMREIRGHISVTQAPPDPGKEETREIRGHRLFSQGIWCKIFLFLQKSRIVLYGKIWYVINNRIFEKCRSKYGGK